MSFLAQVTSTQAKVGIRAIIAAVEGMGKTTLLCNAPRVLLVPMEQGHASITVNKTPMMLHYDHVMMFMDECLAAIVAGQFPYLTIGFDSATALERLIHQATLETDPTYGRGNKKAMTMESALGGYGKAYTYANELFTNFLAKCDLLSQYGINIVLTCHVFAAEVVDPTVGKYDSWDLLLHSPKNQKTYGKREIATQWADLIGFLHEPMFITENKATGVNMGVSANKGRVLQVTRTPAYVAKNRYALVDGINIPAHNGWNELAQALYASKGVDVFNRDV